MAEATKRTPTALASDTIATTAAARPISPARRWINTFIERRLLAWDLTMAALALIYVALGFVEDAVPAPVYQTWFAPIEIILTAIFVVEFFGRLWAAESRAFYLRRHWIDLVALLPAVRLLRFLRAARFLRIMEVARALEGARLLRLGALVRFLTELERAGHRIRWIAKHNGVHVFLAFALGLMVVGGAAVWELEHATNPQFHDLGSAMWWAFATMATVGYGNGPASIAGRVVAAIIMVIGIGCFGLMSATVTTLFIERTHGPDASASELKAMLEDIRARLAHIERELADERAKHGGATPGMPVAAATPEATSASPATVPHWEEGPGELPRA